MIQVRRRWLACALPLLVFATPVGAQTPPVVTGAAAPAQLNPGDSVLLTVAIAPGTPRGDFTVQADLAPILGGLTAFSDSGTDGDVVAGDRVFSRRVVVPAETPFGAKVITAAVLYDLGSTNLGEIATGITLMVGIPPAATGAAQPAVVGVGEPVLLTVSVAPRTPPVGSVSVEAELAEITGSTVTTLVDNGTLGDAVAGDRVYSRLVTVRPDAIEGVKSLPVQVHDAVGVAFIRIPLTVTAPPTQPTAHLTIVTSRGVAPSALERQERVQIVATVTPGTGPRSTNLVASLDLSAFGLPARSIFTDDGAGGCDAIAGDGAYSICLVVPLAAAVGPLTLTGQLTDAQGRVVPLTASTAIAASGDRDADGLSNACETLFGLDPDSAAGNDGAAADPDGDGRTNAQECAAETHPRGTFLRYLAEGAANDFFRTRLALFNPSATPAIALIRVQPESAGERRLTLSIPANTVRHLMPGDLRVLGDGPFATLVESDVDLVVDRTMTWGDGDYGGHVETAVRAPATTWYFAEGATGWRFSLFYLLQNPGDQPADVVVHYLRGPADPVLTRTYVVPPRSRRTIAVDDEEFPAGSGQRPLATTDVAARIEVSNGVPIVAERAMYLSPDGQPFGAGTASVGATAPATRWSFAEGAIGTYFDEYLLLANPGATPAAVQLTLDPVPGSGPATTNLVVAPNSRRTVSVDQLLGVDGASVSAVVDADVPIVAERVMWWPGTAEAWREGHVSQGSTVTASRWGVAGLEIGGPRNVQSFVLVSGSGATVRAYTMNASAPVVCGLPVGGRQTVHLNACPGLVGPLVAVVVEGAADTVVEWTTYSGDGVGAGGGALGVPLLP